MKQIVRITVAVLACAMLIGCSLQEKGEVKEPQKIEEKNGGEQEKTEESTPKESETKTNEDEPLVTVATIYYIDEATEEMITKEVEVKNEYDIWKELQQASILTEECQLLNFNVKEDKKIDLDFNKVLGDRIRNMGIAGETQIIGCIVNTYLDSYNCEQIKLTEEGEELSTSHGASVDGYMGKF